MTKRAARSLTSFIVLIVSFLSLQSNLFQVVPGSMKAGFQADSDQLVMDALAVGGSSLGSKEDAGFRPYRSQFGLQVRIYRAFAWIGSEPSDIATANSAMLSLVIAGLCFFLFDIFSPVGALLCCLSISLSPWLVLFAGSAYWIAWTWFLPLLVGAALGPLAAKANSWLVVLAITLFLAWLLKFLCGYEYASTVVLAALCPVIFHVIRRGGDGRRAFLCLGALALSSVAAFCCALFLHVSHFSKDFAAGLGEIGNLAEKRLYSSRPEEMASMACRYIPSEEDRAKCLENFERSLTVSPLSVVGIYATFRRGLPWLVQDEPGLSKMKEVLRRGDIRTVMHELSSLSGTQLRFMIGTAATTLLCWLGIGIAALKLWRNRPGSRAYFWCLAMSALAPISWFVIAKGHSYIHTFLNFVLWQLPFLPFVVGFLLTPLHLSRRDPAAEQTDDMARAGSVSNRSSRS